MTILASALISNCFLPPPLLAARAGCMSCAWAAMRTSIPRSLPSPYLPGSVQKALGVVTS